MSVLGLDVGTTGCKAMVFDGDGTPLSYAYMEYEREATVRGLDADRLWACVAEVIRRATTGAPEPVQALSISSFGESFVPIDASGRALAEIMLYTDPRGAAQCRDLVGAMGEEPIMQATGIKPHPMYSLSKISYLRQEQPEVFERADKFLLVEDFIIYRLTGECIIDYSLASRTMAFNISSLRWERGLLDLVGIDESRLSTPVPSGTVVGCLLPQVACDLGLGRGTLVVTGGHDQVCAAVGAGVIEEGRAIDGTGTVECITPAFARPILSRAFLESSFACVPHAVGGMYVTYAFNFTGGSLLKWYRDNFAKYEAMVAAERGVSPYKFLDDQGSLTPTDIIVIPHFSGSGTPDMDPSARGAFLGLSLDTDGPTLYRALIEGVTYEMAYNMEILEREGVRIDELRAVGGGAKSDYWLGIKAAVTGRRIVALDVEEAGAAGAAMLASVAVGIHTDVAEAAKRFVRIKKTFEPQPEMADRYAEVFARYKAARAALREIR